MRTKLADRILPHYTRGEELFNMISHIVGGGLGLVVLIACIIVSTLHRNVWGIVGSVIYGISMIQLYTMSSIYHGLKPGRAKKVMQVLDHCSIYFLIAGTYTPITLSAIRLVDPTWCWVLFGIEWGLFVLAVTLNAIDLKQFRTVALILDLVMGWLIVIIWNTAVQALTPAGFWLMLTGGILYTVGAVLYGVGKKVKYMHSVFHLFVVAGSILQFLSIILYAL